MAAEPCKLYRLPAEASMADLEIGYATRGAQLVDCDARRRLAVETAEAEHRIQEEWRSKVEQPRKWWVFWR